MGKSSALFGDSVKQMHLGYGLRVSNADFNTRVLIPSSSVTYQASFRHFFTAALHFRFCPTKTHVLIDSFHLFQQETVGILLHLLVTQSACKQINTDHIKIMASEHLPFTTSTTSQQGSILPMCLGCPELDLSSKRSAVLDENKYCI